MTDLYRPSELFHSYQRFLVLVMHLERRVLFACDNGTAASECRGEVVEWPKSNGSACFGDDVVGSVGGGDIGV